MYLYVNIETLEVINMVQLQALFPETSFPPETEDGITSGAISWTGYTVLQYDPLPTLSILQTVTAGLVRREGDVFIQAWNIVQPTEQQWVNYNTDKINTFLRQANAQVTAIQGRIDMINDAIDIGEEEPGWEAELPIRSTQLKAWKKYRIDLNKIVLQSGWASNVVWPVTPTTYTDEMSSVISTASLS